MDTVSFLDASALVKLLRDEPESMALIDYLDGRTSVEASELCITEVGRAIRRVFPDANAAAALEGVDTPQSDCGTPPERRAAVASAAPDPGRDPPRDGVVAGRRRHHRHHLRHAPGRRRPGARSARGPAGPLTAPPSATARLARRRRADGGPVRGGLACAEGARVGLARGGSARGRLARVRGASTDARAERHRPGAGRARRAQPPTNAGPGDPRPPRARGDSPSCRSWSSRPAFCIRCRHD